MNYKSITRLIEFIATSTFSDEKLIERNLSELIKLIPYFGSIINANTIEVTKDKILDKRLTELELKLDSKISHNDGEIVLDIIEENRTLIYSLISQFQDIIFKDVELKNNIGSYLAVPKTNKSDYSIHKDFKLIIISGASATGKDTIVDKLIKKDYPSSTHIDVLNKFTTRKKRLMDSHYYKFLTSNSFEKCISKDRIIFPYPKREYKYGFDKSQLFKVSQTNSLMFCVFTEFKVLQRAKQFLSEQNISCSFILIEADEAELIDRSWRRNFPEEEVRRRINSIRQDLNFIRNNDKLINEIYDFRVYNGDNVAIDTTYDNIVNFINKNATQHAV